jgi:phospholipid/cholesterol/gamma-HCH transport system substrate-binding protein
MSATVRAVLGLAAALVVVATSVVLVEVADGAFSGAYLLNGHFTRAGEGLFPGSDVDYRGVQVGTVQSVHLSGQMAVVTMRMDKGFRVPSGADATIRPKNLFGAEEVDLSFPSNPSRSWLGPGGTVAHTAVSDELDQLFSSADPLLQQVDAGNLATVVSELAQAATGEGPRIASSIEEGTKLAGLLSDTIAGQLAALDSFASFSSALAPTGGQINAISGAANQALPVFNQAASAYQRLLQSLTPFSQDLAELLSVYHPAISTILADGDNVSRVLVAQQSNIEELVHGLYRYVYKFAKGVSPEVLPDGTHFAYFKTFVLFGDVNNLICNLIAPAQPGLSFLAPLQQAVTGAGSPLNCSAQMAAFDQAQQSAPASTVAATPAAPGGGLPPGAAAATQQLATDAYGALGAAQPSRPGSLQGFIDSLLGP